MHLTLIRHTSVAVDPGICYGQSDVDVSENFETEALHVSAKLNNHLCDAVYSSPSQRCTKLAAFCGYDSPQTDARLMEMNFGDWELQAWDDITDPQLQLWFDNWTDETPTNGESFRQMIDRVETFLNELSRLPYQHVLIFCHAGVIRAAQIILNRIPVRSSFDHILNYGDVVDFRMQTSDFL